MHWVDLYGYWAVLVIVLLESAGVPLPGETILLTAAIYAGRSGRLSIALVIAAAAAGAILGDNLGYTIGREGGFRLLRRYGRYVQFDERKMKVGQYLFLRHGGKVVFFGRFIAILRTWSAFLAGVNRMPWRRFVLANGAGGIIWASAFGLLGWFLGDVARQALGRLDLALGICGGLAALVGVAFTIVNERRLEDAAERALPGPLAQR